MGKKEVVCFTQNSLELKWVMEQASKFESSALMAVICELQELYIWKAIFTVKGKRVMQSLFYSLVPISGKKNVEG